MRRRQTRHIKAPPDKPIQEVELTVRKLGSEGVGVAFHDGKPVLLPMTLPGERVKASFGTGEARVVSLLSQSEERVAAPCRHFGTCGGCAVQHLSAQYYRRYKRDLVVDAMHRHGLSATQVDDVMISPVGSRRRAGFEAVRNGSGIALGFHARASHAIVDIAECPVLAPQLMRLIVPLRQLLLQCLRGGERTEITLTAFENGVDVGIALPRTPDLAILEALSGFGTAQDLARIWWRVNRQPPVPALINRQPIVRFGTVAANVPMGGFLQATIPGQDALIDVVQTAVGKARRVADLFAGCGTFSLPLAAGGASVHAVENDQDALKALAATAARAQLKGLTTECRDLEARPLLVDEFKRFEVVVFDPPRAGAKAQVATLAKADVARIIAISCNPSTFARDAAVLTAAGWTLERVTPVDQFLWSSHIELVADFSRG